MKRIVFCIFVCGSFMTATAQVQNDSAQLAFYLQDVVSEQQLQKQQIEKLTDDLRRSQREVKTLRTDLQALQHRTDSLQQQNAALKSIQASDKQLLSNEIYTTNAQLSIHQNELSAHLLYGSLIAGLLVLIIGGAIAIIVWRMRRGRSSVEEVRKAQAALQIAQQKLQEDSVRIDQQLLELLTKRMPPATNGSTPLASEPNHDLAKKVADEIVRIEMNLSKMDSSIKGYKQLAKAVERIKDNFYANGYEIVDMLGKPYNEGMKVVANFVADETLPEGTQMISGIIKPQINYNGTMIQSAQITVSQNL